MNSSARRPWVTPACGRGRAPATDDSCSRSRSTPAAWPCGSRDPPERERKLRTHAGYEWLYVLSGEMRLILGEHDITMRPGEAAEFDTQLPHWFGPAGDEPVEILSVHGSHGQRMHVRAAPRRTRPPA